MEVKNGKSKEVEFDLSKAVIIIEKDADLNDMFREKFGTDYKMIHAQINSGSLKPEVDAYIKALFDGVILEKKALLKKYLALKDVKVVAEPVAKEVKEEGKVKKVANKMRWGLKAIASDIADNFKGKGTQLHSTAMKVQNLKKIFVRLEQRTWKERFKGETLSDKELREIGGAIETFNKKIESIMNPKK